MSRPLSKSLLQPESMASTPIVAAAPRSRTVSPRAIEATGPASTSPPAAADHRRATVDVGANFYSAAELAELRLNSLPHRREHISRRATRDGWKYREREGKGGGREFSLSDLPDAARAEILHRRVQQQAAKAIGADLTVPRAPLATIAALTHRQAERHSARSVVLEQFDQVKGDRSARATLDVFVHSYNDGTLKLPEWVRADVKKLSRRTLDRWLAARNTGNDETLAGRWAGGRRSVFEVSTEAADFIIGAHATQPLLGGEELHGLLKTFFPQGLPDASGLMLDYPSVATIQRFIRSWHEDARNAADFLAFTDPDRSKSHHRFAAGSAAAGILRPNQLWQIDASPGDTITASGRKTIYALIDIATRDTMAIVTDTPTTQASLLLLARACMAWGVPEVLGTDNGSDFTSKHFRMAVRHMGIHHKIAPPYSPERKPFVERVIKSIQHKFMPLMPGFAGHNVADRTAIRARDTFAKRLGVSDAEAFATVALTGDELHERLTAWLANVYAHRPHAGLGGRTPHDVKAELLQQHPVRFADPQAIGMLLMPPPQGDSVRVVGKKAIRVGNIDYWTDRLIPGQRVRVRLDPADAGKIWLYTDTDPLRFVGIGRNPELAGLDRGELAGRVRAEQTAMMNEGRARLRRLVKKTDMHSVAQMLIGEAAPPAPINDVTHTTPELDEALRAARHEGIVTDIGAHRQIEAEEETHRERFKRAKDLRSLIDAGREISPDSEAWLLRYERSSEFKGLMDLENQGRA